MARNEKLAPPEVEYADEDDEGTPPPFEPASVQKPKTPRVLTMQRALELQRERAQK